VTPTVRWPLTWKQRIVALFRGALEVEVLTFNAPNDPKRPFVIVDDEAMFWRRGIWAGGSK
jgi:hypothetical protein